MKLANTLLAMVAVILFGCSKQPDKVAERLAAVEAAVNQLYSNQVAMHEFVTNQAMHCSSTESNFLTLITKAIDSNDASIETLAMITERLNYLESRTNNVVTRFIQTGPARTPTLIQPTVRGVPKSVYDVIAAKAAQKWGSDYEMQQYEITKQIEAYRSLHP